MDEGTKKLVLKAIKLNQPTEEGQAMFLTSISIRDLINPSYFEINWWDKDKYGSENQGYQRRPDENRIKKITNYFVKYSNPLFTTNIVINSHKPLKFRAENGKQGVIEIDDYPLWIIDGQTRVEGFKYALESSKIDFIADITLPVTILSNFELIDELQQFYVLNQFQKKVSTDLAQRLRFELLKKYGDKYEGMGIGEKWEMQALKLTDLMNTKGEANNVWYSKIKYPNTKKGPSIMISQNSFLTSLKPLFRENGIFTHIKEQGKRYEILRNYWLAIKEFFPNCFVNYHSYVIQKTTGVFSLHDLANRVLFLIYTEDKNFAVPNILRKLNLAFDNKWDSDFWRKDKVSGATVYGSMKGFRLLADEFKENLPDPDIKV